MQQFTCPNCGKVSSVLPDGPRSDATIESAFRKAFVNISPKDLPILSELNDMSLHVVWRPRRAEKYYADWRVDGTHALQFHSPDDPKDAPRNAIELLTPYAHSTENIALFYKQDAMDKPSAIAATSWRHEASRGYPFLSTVMIRLLNERVAESRHQYPDRSHAKDRIVLTLYHYDDREIRGPLLINFMIGTEEIPPS